MWSPDGAQALLRQRTGQQARRANIVGPEPRRVARPRAGYQRHHAARGRRRPPGADQRQRRVDRLRVRRRPVGRRHEGGRTAAQARHRGPRRRQVEHRAHRHLHQGRDRVRPHADEDAAVVVVHGELFLVRLPDGGKATRLTDSPAFDHAASFGPDGKSILFLSDRSGPRGPLPARAGRSRAPGTGEGAQVQGQAADRTRPRPRSAPTFSPKGKRIAFLRARQALDDEARRHRPEGAGRRHAGVRLRLVAGRQVGRLRAHGRLVRQRAVHRPGRRQRRRRRTSPATPPTTAT